MPVHTSNLLNSARSLDITNATTDNSISIDQNGNTGGSVSVDGALHIENTDNTGIGLGVYTNIGATAEGDLVSIKVDNSAFDQDAVKIVMDGAGNALHIEQNGADVTGAIYLDVNLDTQAVIIDRDVVNSNNGTDVYEIRNTSVVNDGATYTKSARILQLANNNVISSGSVTDTSIMLDIQQENTSHTGSCISINNDGNGLSIEIDQDGNSSGYIYGMKIALNNAGAGDVIGIDLSPITTEVFRFRSNAITTAGAVRHQIPVYIDGTPSYLVAYAAGS